MTRVAIIDYGSGNLRSVAKAFEKAGADARVTSEPQALAEASHIVLPGVGAYGDCMAGLRAIPGMIEALHEQAIQRKKPFLGICVGMQMMLERGLEFGEHPGLGWIKGTVVPLSPSDASLKIPHMGWNELRPCASHGLFAGMAHGDHVYFVHSYHAHCENPDDILAETEYGGRIAAAIGRENLLGMQFHPEKSQAAGLALLKNFMRM